MLSRASPLSRQSRQSIATGVPVHVEGQSATVDVSAHDETDGYSHRIERVGGVGWLVGCNGLGSRSLALLVRRGRCRVRLRLGLCPILFWMAIRM